MNRYFLESYKEYFTAVVFSFLVCFMLPFSITSQIHNWTITIFRLFPISIGALLLINFITMICVIFFSLYRIVNVSFFLFLNGIMLGIMISIYRDNLSELMQYLFPHAWFELNLMMFFCAQLKEIIFLQNQKQNTKTAWLKLIVVCVPLWLISGILEGLQHS